MSQAPHVVRGAAQGPAARRRPSSRISLWASLLDPYCGFYMAQTSNNLARDYGISREEQDAFAVCEPGQGGRRHGGGAARRGDRAGHGRRGQARRDASPRTTTPRPDRRSRSSRKLPTAFDKDGFVTARQRVGDRRRRRDAAAVDEGRAPPSSARSRSAGSSRGRRSASSLRAWASVRRRRSTPRSPRPA